jgi:hypothetical protein
MSSGKKLITEFGLDLSVDSDYYYLVFAQKLGDFKANFLVIFSAVCVLCGTYFCVNDEGSDCYLYLILSLFFVQPVAKCFIMSKKFKSYKMEVKMLVRCPHCGVKSPAYAKICQWCGGELGPDAEKLPGEEPVAAVSPVESAGEQEVVPPGRQIRKCPYCDAYCDRDKDVCQNCGETLEPYAPELPPSPEVYDINNKKISVMLKFAMRKAFTGKVWLGAMFWGAIIGIPLIFLAINIMRAMTPVFDKLKEQGYTFEKVMRPAGNMFKAKPGDITPEMYLIYAGIFLIGVLAYGILSGFYGYVFGILRQGTIDPKRTFWESIRDYYLRFVLAGIIIVFVGMFVPMSVIQLTGNPFGVKVLLVLWNILSGLYFTFVVIFLFGYDYGIGDAFIESFKFYIKNFFRIIWLSVVLLAFYLLVVGCGIAVIVLVAIMVKGMPIGVLLLPVAAAAVFVYGWFVAGMTKAAFFLSYAQPKKIRSQASLLETLG